MTSGVSVHASGTSDEERGHDGRRAAEEIDGVRQRCGHRADSRPARASSDGPRSTPNIQPAAQGARCRPRSKASTLTSRATMAIRRRVRCRPRIYRGPRHHLDDHRLQRRGRQPLRRGHRAHRPTSAGPRARSSSVPTQVAEYLDRRSCDPGGKVRHRDRCPQADRSDASRGQGGRTGQDCRGHPGGRLRASGSTAMSASPRATVMSPFSRRSPTAFGSTA